MMRNLNETNGKLPIRGKQTLYKAGYVCVSFAKQDLFLPKALYQVTEADRQRERLRSYLGRSDGYAKYAWKPVQQKGECR